MSESRICPVCENEIPEDARFLCPHCHFEVKWLDDENTIEKARIKFAGDLSEMENLTEETAANERPAWMKYYISGVIDSIIPGSCVSLFFGSIEGIYYQSFGWSSAFQPLLVALPGGFLAGFVGGRLAKKFPESRDICHVILTAVRGFLFSVVSIVLMGLILWFS